MPNYNLEDFKTWLNHNPNHKQNLNWSVMFMHEQISNELKITGVPFHVYMMSSEKEKTEELEKYQAVIR